MKMRHLLLASAVSIAFGSTAFARQDQSSQTGQQDQTSAAQGGGQSDMQSMHNDPQMVRQLQQKLKQQGYDVGAIDGKWGPNTQKALRQWQQSQGMSASGNLDQQSLSALGIQGSDMNGSGAQGATAGRDSTGSDSQGTMGNGAAASPNGSSTGAGGASGATGAGTGATGNTGTGSTGAGGGAAGAGGGAGGAGR